LVVWVIFSSMAASGGSPNDETRTSNQ